MQSCLWPRAVASTSPEYCWATLYRTFVRGGGVTIAPRRLVALGLLCAGVIGLLVLPGVAAQTTTDYDTDNDGLIEVSNLAQLNAIRWDVDGDGAADNPSASSDPDDPNAPTQAQAYAAAFPDAAAGMGCPSTGCIGYELTADLDFDTNGSDDADSGDTYWNGGLGWDPIGYYRSATDNSAFTATFDGNNRSITNLFINRPDADYQGLFGYFGGSAAEIRNVRLRDVNVTGNERVGGLVGFHQGGGVSNSSASGTVSGQQWIGGLVGQNRGTISDSSASVAVSGQQQIGGLVGRNHSGAISASSASGAVSGQQWVGGLVGTNAAGATIISSHATGTVTGMDPNTSSDIGGLVGYNAGTIEDSYHKTGTVSGQQQIGGLVGYNYGGISNSHASGAVSGEQAIGGLAGVNYGVTISASSATGTVMGNSEVGGLVGQNSGTISTSHATGTVTGTDPATSRDIGGLVGYNAGTIEDSYHKTGTVSGYERIGGLVGTNAAGATIRDDSYASSTVSGQQQIGGLVGYNVGTIEDSYHQTGAVTGHREVGGLVGHSYQGTIRASHATGTVTGTETTVRSSTGIGGLVGVNERGTIEDSYHETGMVMGSKRSGEYTGGNTGGLVGVNQAGTIRASYSTGTVRGADNIGGLVGQNTYIGSTSGTIRASYATGTVRGLGSIGGLVGTNDRSTVRASYATGTVIGSENIGGLVGVNIPGTTFTDPTGTITDSYWDTVKSGRAVGVGSDDSNNDGMINDTETETPGATGKTTGELQTPRSYTDSGSNTEAIYADWNLDLDSDSSTDDDPWDFGTASQYPVLKVDFNGDGSIDADDIDPQRRSSGGGGGGGGSGGGSSSKKSSGGGSRAPSPPPVPTRSPIIGSTPAATAMELAGDLLVIQRHDQPGVEVEVGVGWISQDGQRIIAIGFVRDGDLGQTYAVVRREGDGQVVRRWIAPDSPLVYAVPWARS